MLRSEQDLSTKRNAFQMLCNHAQDLATNYLLSQVRQVQLPAVHAKHRGIPAAIFSSSKLPGATWVA